jgi:hypothetical protein
MESGLPARGEIRGERRSLLMVHKLSDTLLRMRLLKSILAIIGAVGSLLILGILALPSIIIGLDGGFREKEVLNRSEPRLNLNLVITKKVRFPANERVDPSIDLRMELREHSTGRILDQARLKLFEDSEYNNPVISWSPKRVLISEFDKTSEQEVSLKMNP